MLLKSIKDEIFKNKDIGRDEIKEVFNNLSVDFQGVDFTLNQNTRFISGPTVPTVHIKPRKSIIVILTFVASLFYFVIAAFVLHWWQNNKKSDTSSVKKTPLKPPVSLLSKIGFLVSKPVSY